MEQDAEDDSNALRFFLMSFVERRGRALDEADLLAEELGEVGMGPKEAVRVVSFGPSMTSLLPIGHERTSAA